MKIDEFGNGEIKYVRHDDEDDGPGVYEASFFISCHHGPDGAEFHNAFRVGVPVLTAAPNAPYDQVEDQAAKSLPAFFRSLADALDVEIAAADRRREERLARKRGTDAPSNSPA